MTGDNNQSPWQYSCPDAQVNGTAIHGDRPPRALTSRRPVTAAVPANDRTWGRSQTRPAGHREEGQRQQHAGEQPAAERAEHPVQDDHGDCGHHGERDSHQARPSQDVEHVEAEVGEPRMADPGAQRERRQGIRSHEAPALEDLTPGCKVPEGVSITNRGRGPEHEEAQSGALRGAPTAIGWCAARPSAFSGVPVPSGTPCTSEVAVTRCIMVEPPDGPSRLGESDARQ